MTTPTLPPLRADRVDAMESVVFARIADERAARRRRRRTIWTGVGAAAAVVIVAAVVGPALTATTGTSGSSVSGVSEAGGAVDPGLGIVGGSTTEGARGESAPVAPGDTAGGAASDSAASTGSTADAGRDIVATGSSTVEVDDVPAAIAQISDAATSAGGYVESSQVGSGGMSVIPLEGNVTQPAPASGWITVRVPAEALFSVMEGLSTVGDVTATSVNRSDVTEQTVDLRARVAAGEASVARLTELMAQAASVSDLIAAETALSERQAQLDSDRAVLKSIESQVAMSSLSVQLNVRSQTVTADPAGFGDGLVAGWNGLVASLNGVVIGLGFLLPWIAVAAVALLIVWGVRRIVRKRRGSHEA